MDRAEPGLVPPPYLGPKIDEVKVELGIFDIHIFWFYDRGA